MKLTKVNNYIKAVGEPFDSKKSKKLYFQRKHKEIYVFPLVIEHFFTIFTAEFGKSMYH